MTDKLYRIIDANLNRLKESLRVCDDIARFVLNDRVLTKHFKALRHSVKKIVVMHFLKKRGVIKQRSVKKDIGKKSTKSEKVRRNFLDIYLANTSRAKESSRVLEEITKLLDPKIAQKFKTVRFKVYELEKRGEERLANLCDSG